MRITRMIIVFAAASALTFGCAGDDGETTTDNKTDSGGGATDAASSSGGDATTNGGGDATSSSSSGGDATALDGASAKKYGTCAAVGDCVVNACLKVGFKSGCEAACLGDATPAAVQKSVTLLTCAKDTCVAKVCKESEDLGKCVMGCIPDHCGGGLLLCLDDGGAGTKPCSATFPCMETCEKPGTPPFTCMANCVNSLDADGKKYLKALMSKASEHGGFDQCGEKCSKEMVQCLNNGKWGKDTCLDTMLCSQKCSDEAEPTTPAPGGGKQPGGEPDKEGGNDGDGGGCVMQCLAKASEKAAAAFFGAISCMDGDDTDPSCSAKLLACIDPQGPNTCAETVPCTSTCLMDAIKGGAKPEDAEVSCSFGCLKKATKEGAMAFVSMAAMCEDNPEGKSSGGTPGSGGGGDPDPPNLPGKSSETDVGPSPDCFKSIVACAGGAKGTDSCAAMVGCIGKCDATTKSDAEGLQCSIECTAKSSKAGSDDFVKHQSCAQSCAKQCMTDKDPKLCNTKCWGADKDCMAAQAACTPKKV